MTCGGCSGAISRILSKEEAITKFETSIENQQLLVWGPENVDELVMEKLQKWATASKKELAFVEKRVTE
jgi:copper chaperone